MSDTEDTLLTFPCEFPIKIMGTADSGLRSAIEGVVDAQPADRISITERPSRGGNYLALTLTVRVQSREQLDDLYRAIGVLEQVRVVL